MCLQCAELAVKQAAQPIYPLDASDPFGVLMSQMEEEMQAIAEHYARTGDAALFEREFANLIEHNHYLAHLIGQDILGVQNRIIASGRAYQIVRLGSGQAAPEVDFIKGFGSALSMNDPRYIKDNVIDISAILQRMRFYQGKVRGTAGWGTLDASSPLDKWKWVLGATEDHCFDCPYNASLGAFTRDQWYSTPGSGDTPCLFNCKCHLVRVSDGVTTVKPYLSAA